MRPGGKVADTVQYDLFDQPKPLRAFSGETYDPERDYERLKGQLRRVYNVMKDGNWRILAQIRARTGHRDSEAAISARLRDFRKKKFGGHTVKRLSLGGGLFIYKLILREINDGTKLDQ